MCCAPLFIIPTRPWFSPSRNHVTWKKCSTQCCIWLCLALFQSKTRSMCTYMSRCRSAWYDGGPDLQRRCKKMWHLQQVREVSRRPQNLCGTFRVNLRRKIISPRNPPPPPPPLYVPTKGGYAIQMVATVDRPWGTCDIDRWDAQKMWLHGTPKFRCSSVEGQT